MKCFIYILLLTVLAGCSSNSSLVSSFSQRKYTKGYFVDAIGDKPSVITKRTNESMVTHTIPVIQHSTTETNFRVNDKVNSTEMLSVKQKKPVRNISAITVSYKKVIELGDSTKTTKSTNPKKLNGFQKFIAKNWLGIYIYTVLILGLLTKLTTGMAYTIINIAFFISLIPLALDVLFVLVLIIDCIITKQPMW